METQFIELTVQTGKMVIINISQIKAVTLNQKYQTIIDMGREIYIVRESYEDVVTALKCTCSLTQIKQN